MIISLIGYRGTGKSTIARPLADALGWTAIDADIELERRAGKTIRQIFADSGEPEFRRLERETLVALLQQERLVIAAGGGAILNAETRRDLKAAGPVIWLQCGIDTIEHRLFGDATTAERRPSLTGKGAREEIQELLAFREPLYRETSNFSVATDRPLPGAAQCDAPTVSEIVNYLIQQLAPWLKSSATDEVTS